MRKPSVMSRKDFTGLQLATRMTHETGVSLAKNALPASP